MPGDVKTRLHSFFEICKTHSGGKELAAVHNLNYALDTQSESEREGKRTITCVSCRYHQRSMCSQEEGRSKSQGAKLEQAPIALCLWHSDEFLKRLTCVKMIAMCVCQGAGRLFLEMT